MKAFKCDRCKKFYENYAYDIRKMYFITKHPNISDNRMDLCEKCHDELRKWVNAYSTTDE